MFRDNHKPRYLWAKWEAPSKLLRYTNNIQTSISTSDVSKVVHGKKSSQQTVGKESMNASKYFSVYLRSLTLF